MKIYKTALVAILFISVNVYANNPSKVNVNGVDILIPVPDTFYSVDSSMLEIKDMFVYMTPLGLEFVSGLLHEDDLIDLLDGTAPSFEQFIHLTTIDKDISISTFKLLINDIKKINKLNKEKLKNDINSLFKFRDIKASAKYDNNPSIKNTVKDIDLLDSFLDKNNVYGVSGVTDSKKNVDGDIFNYKRITTTLNIWLKNRFIKANFYSYYKKYGDVSLQELKANSWVDAMFELNKKDTEKFINQPALELFINSEKGKDWLNKQ